MIRRFAMLLLGGMSAVAVFGCGGSDSEQEQPPPPPALNFARITREVINTNTCGGVACHTGTVAGFMLASNNQLYTTLVGAKATGPFCVDSDMVRIVPGDPDNSLLFQKISVIPPPCGEPMPTAPLPAEKIDLVRSWIEAGAPKD